MRTRFPDLYIALSDRYKRHMVDNPASDASAALRELDDQALHDLAGHLRLERLRRMRSWRTCSICGRSFLGRFGATYCSGRCRTKAYRHRQEGNS